MVQLPVLLLLLPAAVDPLGKYSTIWSRNGMIQRSACAPAAAAVSAAADAAVAQKFGLSLAEYA